MIVYNVLEEIRIIIYLLIFGIYIATSYDFLDLIRFRKIWKNVLINIFGCFIILLTSYFFVYRLKEGYIPQYGIIIVILGLLLYYFLLRRNFVKCISYIKYKYCKILSKIVKIIKPLNIFKTTFLLIKQKIKKFNIKSLYKKKKL